jgi:hypothetical protein
MKKDNTLWIIGSLILVSFVLLAIIWFLIFFNQKIVTLNQDHDNQTKQPSGAIFSEDLWRKQLELYLDFQEKENSKNNIDVNDEIVQTPDQNPPRNNESIPQDQATDDQNPIATEAFLFSSLTGSPGSISLTGKAVGYSVLVNDVPVDLANGKFSSGTSSSFTVTFKNDTTKRVVRVSSPSYSTNLAVQALSIGIDPFTSYMTLYVKLNLKLPGSMTGELINTTNGAASSTSTQNGEFNLSVPLAEGNNAITARGSWLTISLDLPSINVSITN